MTFENLITLALVVGFGYMMFKGGGCCGHDDHTKHESHAGHEGHLKDVTPGNEKSSQESDTAAPVKGSCCH